MGKPWAEMFPKLTQRFNGYVFHCIKDCIYLVLAQIQVLFPTIPVEKLAEPSVDEHLVTAVEGAEAEVEKMAMDIATQMKLPRSPEYVEFCHPDEVHQHEDTAKDPEPTAAPKTFHMPSSHQLPKNFHMLPSYQLPKNFHMLLSHQLPKNFLLQKKKRPPKNFGVAKNTKVIRLIWLAKSHQ
jgi:hypothetical protein